MDVETNNERTEENVALVRELLSVREQRRYGEGSSESIPIIVEYDHPEQLALADSAVQYEVERKKKKKRKKHSSHEAGISASCSGLGTEIEIGAPVDLSSHKPNDLMDASTSRYYDPNADTTGMDVHVGSLGKRRPKKAKLGNLYDEAALDPASAAVAQLISTDEISVTLCQGKTEKKRKRKRKNPQRRGEDGEGNEEFTTPVDLSSHRTSGFINPSTSRQIEATEEHLFTGQYTRELYKKILAAEVEALKNESQDGQDEQDENMFDKDEMKLPCLDEYLNTSLEEGDPFVPSFTGDPICPYCNKVFSKPAHRNHHVKAVHLKIKPYKCSVCGKAFSEKQTLKVHGFLHTDEKRFECHLCDTSFRNVSNLYQHQKTHINTGDEDKARKRKLGLKDNILQMRIGEDSGVKHMRIGEEEGVKQIRIGEEEGSKPSEGDIKSREVGAED